MNGCRQDALTINMAREHAATPCRNTGGEDDKGKKQEAAQHTRKKQIAGGKSTAKALTLTGNSTPALTHTNTHHHGAVSPRVRGFGPPHNKRTHCQQSSTNGQEQEETHHHRLQSNPTENGIQPQPCSQHTTHAEQAITQRAARKSDSSSINDAATTFPVIPPTMEFDARLKAVIGGASRLQEK
ncbi:hypothetical protein TCDM_12487 [Trypanosoma cruzi Dm28c]|uniref:Uncharacterized protein n=1 Tax=Trypanosoma cruzi Dm28c TaxID=1416333 RepID=V5ARJ6_TRYCR|nr:hypothetical protein TCDM_12487 [Trypanosoma cruzi Dm28c]